MTSPEAVIIDSPSLSSTSLLSPDSETLICAPSSKRVSTFLRTSSTMSKRLEISRSRLDVSIFACICAALPATGAAIGKDPVLLGLARVGPGAIVQASSSVRPPSSGIGTCSMAIFAITRKRSSETSVELSTALSLLPNGHAILYPPISHDETPISIKTDKEWC